MASPTEYKVAGDPFNKPNADVILRSLDGTHFHVHWVVLGLTSGFFEDMEKMPQPAGGSERAIIPVQEDSATLDALLRFMYPGGDKPAIDDIMRIGDVLCAAVKYQVDDVVKYLKRQLSLFDDPLRVFIVGCLADLEDVAYQAAIEWCQENAFDLEDTYVPEMTVLPSATYFRLLHFCDALNRGGEISENYSFTRPPSVLASSAPEPTATFTVPSPFNRPSAHANIIIRSNDKVDFYVNEGILALASSKLESLLHDAPDSSPRSHDGYRVLALPEDANILLPLLQLTYPVVSPHIRDWELLTHVLLTAYKYELVRAAELAKRAWVKEIPTEPLRSYFIAVQQGWTEEAKRAARHAVLLPADEYCPEMELVPASCYDRFLRYRQKCRRNVISARRAFMDDLYLHAAVDQQEVYDTFWHAHDVSTMFHYSLHATWARAGATSPGVRPSQWTAAGPLPRALGLGGEWPAHIQQLMSCLHTWNGRHGDILELIHNYDKYGGQAMDAVDQLAFEV